MEIDDVIFQDLGSFGKGRLFRIAKEKFSILVWENCKISSYRYNLAS